jgi:cation diffusion facilitator family transporter
MMSRPSQSRDAEVRRVLLVALCFNLIAWGVKFLWGQWTQSISMQADALHSLLDAFSSVLGFFGVLMAAQPPDAEHPYGHGKFETVAAIGISVFIFIGCFEIVTGSITRFQSGTGPHVTPTSFIIMLVMMMANGLLSRWEGRMGNLFHSEVLGADALHTRSDFYASLAVIMSLVGGKIGYPLLDPLAALAIAGVIGYAGVRILIDSVKVLTDTSQMDSKAVETLVMGIDGVLACHAIRTRGSRHQVYMDLHLHTSPEMKLAAAHELAHCVEQTIMSQFEEVREVVVHLEPHLPNLEND